MGFQWAGKDVIGYVHETYPDLRLMQTETECGNGSNDRAEMEHTFELLKHYFSNGANFYMYWNMVLESNGLSHWGWRQNSMISISEDDQVVYNPEFYLMKHFSYFIRPNARFINLGTGENCLAFVNDDDEVIIIYYNGNEKPVIKTFAVGESNTSLELKGKSINTVSVKL